MSSSLPVRKRGRDGCTPIPPARDDTEFDARSQISWEETEATTCNPVPVPGGVTLLGPNGITTSLPDQVPSFFKKG